MLFQTNCVAHSVKVKLHLNNYGDLYKELIPVK